MSEANPAGYKVQVQVTFTYWATATDKAEARENLQSWSCSGSFGGSSV